MNANRLMNMAMRMAMRYGMKFLGKKARQQSKPNPPNGSKDQRAFRGKQPQGDAAKRMRALKRTNKF